MEGFATLTVLTLQRLWVEQQRQETSGCRAAYGGIHHQIFVDSSILGCPAIAIIPDEGREVLRGRRLV